MAGVLAGMSLAEKKPAAESANSRSETKEAVATSPWRAATSLVMQIRLGPIRRPRLKLDNHNLAKR